MLQASTRTDTLAEDAKDTAGSGAGAGAGSASGSGAGGGDGVVDKVGDEEEREHVGWKEDEKVRKREGRNAVDTRRARCICSRQ